MRWGNEASRESDRSTPTSQWVLTGLALWIFFGCVDLAIYSWHLPETLDQQVERYFFHLTFGWIPSGILLLYLPFFLSIFWLPRRQVSLPLVLGAGILFRIALLPSAPILETDLYRYLWDGHMVNTGHNPYRYSPESIEAGLALDHLPEELAEDFREILEQNRDDHLHREILANINNKSVPTLYFPMAQCLFALGDRIVSFTLPSHSDEGEEINWPLMAETATVVWKIVLLPIDIGILFLIVSMLRGMNRNPCWVLIYAWCPLVLKEYGNTGHYDPLVVFLTLLGLRLMLEIGRNPRFRILSGGVFGAAIGCKAFPVLFLPFLWRRLRWVGMASAGAVLALLYLPFLGIGSRLFTGLATYSDRWEFNSSLVSFNEWWISSLQSWWASHPVTEGLRGDGTPNPLFSFAGVEFSLDAFFLAKFLSGLFILAVLAYLTWQSLRENEEESQDPARQIHRVYLMIGTLLLASPVADPWYVCWIVPFLCFFPNKAWLYLTFSQQVYYLYFWSGWDYVRFEDLPWLGIDSTWEIGRLIEYIPFYLMLLLPPCWKRLRESGTLPQS